jgi:hypothetical protein
MKTKKTITPGSDEKPTNEATEALKNISELGKTELLRKKKVDPGIE